MVAPTLLPMSSPSSPRNASYISGTGVASPIHEEDAFLAASDLSLLARTRSSALSALNRLGLAEFLHRDPRPTFVLDVGMPDKPGDLLQPAYCNPSLLSAHDGGLLDQVSGKANMDIPGTRTYSFNVYNFGS